MQISIPLKGHWRALLTTRFEFHSAETKLKRARTDILRKILFINSITKIEARTYRVKIKRNITREPGYHISVAVVVFVLHQCIVSGTLASMAGKRDVFHFLMHMTHVFLVMRGK